MSNMKKMMKTMWPIMPDMMDWGKRDPRKDWEEFKSNVDNIWDQYQEMQKAAKEAWKEQWTTFFNQCIELEKAFVSALPDQKAPVPGMPAAPLSPKEVAEKAVEFQEMANDQAVKQNDTVFDFHMKSQKKMKEAVDEVVKNVEENIDKQKEEAGSEEKKAKEPKEEKEPKEAKEPKETKETKVTKVTKVTKAPKAAKEPRQTKGPRQPQKPQEPQESKEPQA